MDKRIIYEHLVCKAFMCGRLGVYFADANVYDNANTSEKLFELLIYIKVSLAKLLIREDVTPNQKSVVKKILDTLINSNFLELNIEDKSAMIDDVLIEIEKCTY